MAQDNGIPTPINLTGKLVRIILRDGRHVDIPFAEGTLIPTATQVLTPKGTTVGCGEGFLPVPVMTPTFKDVFNLPPPNPAHILIVPTIVRHANPKRWDIYSPGELVRDGEGRVLGISNLVGN